MDQRLRGQDLADRRSERRPAGLAPDLLQLVERLQQAIVGGVGAEVRVERRDEPGREVVLRGADGDPRRVRRHDLVADVLVDEVGGLPQPRDVDAGVEAHARERGGERLAGDPVQRERERVDGARDHVRAGPGGLERVRERGAAGALAVEADGKAARLLDAADELARLVRLEPAARVVHERPRRLDLRQLLRLLDELVHRALVARAVDEAGMELLARGDDRLARLPQVRDVVERIVQAEDVDPVLRRRGDEAADEVGADGACADEEAAAQRQAERRRRPRLQRANPLPRALDAAADGRVEDTAAGDLEQREAGAVEHLGDPEQLAGRHAPGQRLLREQANGGVDEPRHVRRLPSAGPGGDLVFQKHKRPVRRVIKLCGRACVSETQAWSEWLAGRSGSSLAVRRPAEQCSCTGRRLERRGAGLRPA